MSWPLMEAVCDLALPDGEWRILMLLAKHANHDGTNARPGIARLVRVSGKAERTVQTILRTLEQKGLIVPTAYRKGGREHVTVYRLTLSAPDERVQPAAPFSPERVQFDAVKGAAGCTPIRPERTEEEDCRVGVPSGPPTKNDQYVEVPDAVREIDRKLRTAFGEVYRPSINFYDRLEAYQVQGVDLVEVLARVEGIDGPVKNACALVLTACKRETSGSNGSVADGGPTSSTGRGASRAPSASRKSPRVGGIKSQARGSAGLEAYG